MDKKEARIPADTVRLSYRLTADFQGELLLADLQLLLSGDDE